VEVPVDFRSASHIEEALSRLGELLEASDAEPVGLLVCGGAALIVRGYVPRTTRDVDVLTYFDVETVNQRDLERHMRLPEMVREMARAVAADMDIDEDWLNVGPSSLVSLGLPEGLMSRASGRDYGRCLKVLFLGRVDQIHLKLYASLSREERHVQDLLALKPTRHEVEQAKKWVEAVAADGFLPADLAALIRDLGYEYLLR